MLALYTCKINTNRAARNVSQVQPALISPICWVTMQGKIHVT